MSSAINVCLFFNDTHGGEEVKKKNNTKTFVVKEPEGTFNDTVVESSRSQWWQ